MKRNEIWFYRNDNSALSMNDGWVGTAIFLGFAAFIATFIGVIGSIAEGNPMWLLVLLTWLPTLLMLGPGMLHVTENMSDSQKSVWLKSRRYARELPKGTIPDIPVDVIMSMERHDLNEVSNKLDDLKNAYDNNQKAIKIQDHRVDDIKAALKDRSSYLNEHTRELKKMGELR